MKIKVLAVILACLSCFFFTTATTAYADTISYPFDSITIESAYHFDIVFDEVPDEDSYFYGMVNQGETVEIYVGNIKMESQDNSSYSKIVIVTNEDDEDIAQWLINSSYADPGVMESITFSSHITINPEVGVIKSIDDLTNFTHTATVIKTASNECTFIAANSSETFYQEFEMVALSYEEETNLNIEIAAYTGG